jgi:predicted RecA/RadA family phage recombinase
MNSFYQSGVFADYTAVLADVEPGEIVDGVGIGVGIADNLIPNGTLGALRVAGVYKIDNPDDTAFAHGVTVGWDATNEKAVGAGAGDYDIGTAYAAYVAGDLVVQVAINGAVG